MQRLFTCKVLSSGYLPALRCVVYCGFHHPFCLFISSGQGNTTRQSTSKQQSSSNIFTRRLFYVVSNKLPTHSSLRTLASFHLFILVFSLASTRMQNIKHKYSGSLVKLRYSRNEMLKCRGLNYFILSNIYTKLIMRVVKSWKLSAAWLKLESGALTLFKDLRAFYWVLRL